MSKKVDRAPQKKLGLEILGVVLLVLTALLVLSLVSYTPTDEALNVVGGTSRNLAGKFGASAADYLIQFMGLGAYFVPLLFFLWGVNCFLSPGRRIQPSRYLGVLLGAASFCALLSLYFERPVPLWGITFRLPGGVLGDLARKLLLIPYLNTWGAFMVVWALFLIAIMLVTKVSLRDIFIFVFDFCGEAVGEIKSVFSEAADKNLPLSAPSPKERNLPKTAKKEEPGARKKAPPKKEEPPPPPPPSSPPIIVSREKEVTEESFDLTTAFLPGDGNFRLPDLSLLEQPRHISLEEVKKGLLDKSNTIEGKLRDFGIDGRIVQVHLGPVITRYEFEPAPGIKLNKIANMGDDLALALKALSVRIVAPIPGKSVVGIEVPNKKRQVIYLKEVLAAEQFQNSPSCLALALGKDTEGNPYVTNLAHMPHLLIAGATGSGKSVALNTIICSILYKATPAEVRFVMVDPKMLELGIYNGIPHLLGPVVTNPKKAAAVLHWATREMEERYQRLADAGVRNIDQFNEYVRNLPPPENPEEEPLQALPYIVIIIDEFADLMLMAAKDIEGLITRLAQMARAVGIHLIVATQRPSVDVITGIIKANFPCRISFRVASKIDSRTILDVNGAEKLLGRGDMLFIPPHTSLQERVHGAMVTEKEVKAIVDCLQEQSAAEEDAGQWQPSAEYDALVLKEDEDGAALEFDDGYDEFYDQAVDLVMKTGQASISMIQRRFRIGYNRAARMVEVMEKDGVVGPAIVGKPREVLVRAEGGGQ